jgi:hypothetical protein
MSASDTAKSFVDDWANKTDKSEWKNIDRADLAQGLKDRVDFPDLVSSDGVNLCGPAAYFRNLAEDKPIAYVNFGMQLYDTTRANLGTRIIKTKPKLRNAAIPNTLQAVDWMMLASLRSDENIALDFDSPSDGWAGLTMPNNLVKWFKQASYSSVTDDTNLVFNKDAEHINKARDLFSHGYNICLLIRAQMMTVAMQGDWSMWPDHWVTLLEPVNIYLGPNKSSQIVLRVHSWGRRYRIPESGILTTKQFAKNYYGYVAARYREDGKTGTQY